MKDEGTAERGGAGMLVNDTLAEEKAAGLRSKVLHVIRGGGGGAA